jgi:hypothetical protein
VLRTVQTAVILNNTILQGGKKTTREPQARGLAWVATKAGLVHPRDRRLQRADIGAKVLAIAARFAIRAGREQLVVAAIGIVEVAELYGSWIRRKIVSRRPGRRLRS